MTTPGPRVVVIGGGLHGCSAALHFARRGARVVLVETGDVGDHASGLNAGGVRQLMRDSAEIPLAVAAMAAWERLDALLGSELAASCGFVGGVGQIAVAESEADIQAIERRAQLMRGLGWTHEEPIDAAELRLLVPGIAGHCLGGMMSRCDGHADPLATTRAFAAAAVRAGVDLRTSCRVLALDRDAEGWRVTTDRDILRVEIVVNCAGAWGGEVARLAGEAVPCGCDALSMQETAPVPIRLVPVLIGVSRPLSLKQRPDGRLLIGGGVRGIADLAAGRAAVIPERLTDSLHHVSALLPNLPPLRVERRWAGLEAWTPDGLPFIGAGTAAGLYHAFGFSGHGFQLGPIVGAVLAKLALDGHSEFDLLSVSPSRPQPSSGGG